MSKKKTIIQCPCHYTRIGIETVLKNMQFSEKCEISVSFSELGECGKYLRTQPKIDILLLTLSSAVASPIATLHILGEYLPLLHPDTKIVLIADMMSVDAMARYLCGLENVLDVLDTSNPLQVLQEQLLGVFNPHNGMKKLNYTASRSLSLREVTVLVRLLEGEKMMHIAGDLQLSPKTISFYKRSAMVKLGIRKYQPLMINRSHKKIVFNIAKSENIETRNGFIV
ncbi:helix-turn-helix transcriptional regulator [Serratia aquatilis]|uniref:LuxR C-terminal-related transcriptional regulator n=1 Tax=Serratia aquatilis TaxID=1737515 RepID=A0ABV6ECU0_9GAMM